MSINEIDKFLEIISCRAKNKKAATSIMNKKAINFPDIVGLKYGKKSIEGIKMKIKCTRTKIKQSRTLLRLDGIK